MNCIIIHGCPSNKEKAMNPATRTYDKHWIPWLKKELEKRDVECYTPLMPEPWQPKYQDWKREINKLSINKNSVLVWHSCGGAFLVRWLKETEKKIPGLVLVSLGKIGKTKKYSTFYGGDKIMNIDKNVKNKIIIFTSNDDIKEHIDGAHEYEKELPAKVIFLKDRGHFTFDDMGTEEFPELLEAILK